MRILSFSSVLLSSLLLSLGLALLITSVGIRLEGASEILIGLVNASYFLGAIGGSLLSVDVISKVGHIRSFAFFASMLALFVLLHIVFKNIYFVMLFRVIIGFANYSLMMVLESWLNEQSPNDYRSRILAVYTLVFYLAYYASSFVLSASIDGALFYVIAASFVIASSMPIALTKIAQPPLPKPRRMRIPKVFNIVPLALMGSFIAGVLVAGFYAMSSVFVLSKGIGADGFASFMGFSMLGALLVQIPMGKASDSFGRKPAIMLASFIIFCASLGMLAFAHNEYMLYGMGFLLSCGVFTIYSLALARANDRLPDEFDVVEVGRSLLLVYGLGSFLAPIVIGIVMYFFGANAFLYVFLLFSCILFLFAITQDGVPKEERSVYIPIVGENTNAITELDPRSD
ncbi:MAG: MFS transporter [Deltaproteobacteria bacterium]|nr:MAG: MFS transporter [Deltaproteobacteria bacterium]